MVKIRDLPDKLWVVSLKSGIDADFWKTSRGLFVYPLKKKLYCLNKLDNSVIDKYLDNSTWSETETLKLTDDSEENINIIKNFIRQFIIYKGQQRGLRYDGKLKCLFFNNKKLYANLKKKRRIVATVYPKISNEDRYASLAENRQLVKFSKKKRRGNSYQTYRLDEVNFVRHYGLNFYPDYFDGEFYVVFNVIIMFTKDGGEIIRGESAQKIHYSFTQKFAYNDTELSKLSYWISLLGIGNKSFSDANGFSISIPLQIKATTSYKSGQQFDVNLLNYMSDGYDV